MSPTSLEVRDVNWRKAARSAGNGACVEVASVNPRVLVRDSRDQNGPAMRYSGSAWQAFLTAAKRGRFDPDFL